MTTQTGTLQNLSDQKLVTGSLTGTYALKVFELAIHIMYVMSRDELTS